VFYELGNGYDVVCGDNFSHVGWRSVRKVVERARYFQFCFNNYDSFIIPKRFFRDDSEQQFLRKIVQNQVGREAELTKSNDVH
jgi:hypothetical protein